MRKEQVKLCLRISLSRQKKPNNLSLNSVSDLNDFNLLIFSWIIKNKLTPQIT